MKITFPECQIDIDVNEVIALMTFIEDREPKIVFDGKIDPLPPFDPDKLREASFDRDQVGDKTGSKSGASADTDPPEGIGFEEQAPEPETTNVTVTFKRKKPKDMERSEKAKAMTRNEKHRWSKRKVDVMVDGDWHIFDSVSEAARFIGAGQNNLSACLQAGREVYRGYKVRYHISDNQDNPELDACLAEIDKSNKTPYQPTNPVR